MRARPRVELSMRIKTLGRRIKKRSNFFKTPSYPYGRMDCSYYASWYLPQLAKMRMSEKRLKGKQ
jgi:hypothetical protein